MKGLGIILIGFIALGMLTNSLDIALWVYVGAIMIGVVYGCIRGYNQTKEAKKERINRKFEESIESLRTSNYDAKHKFCMVINFNTLVKGIGYTVTKTSDDKEYLKSRAKAYMTNCHVEIYENKSKYPNFDWVTVDYYNLSF
jgi:hypothetical protein